MTDFSTIELHTDPRGVATLWLNRPDKHNAFNAEMIAELIQALRQVAADDSLRFLVLRGQGRHFCAGADLGWMQASAQLDYAANLRDAHELGELMSLLYHLPCPTLAVVQGAAFGGAVGLTACCDIAIGALDASFSLSEVRIGLVPAVISPYVVQAIGERAARRYALSAERFSGERARELGLLAECYPAGELEAEVEQWVANLLQNSPQAMRAAKALLQDVGSGVLGDALRQRTESVIAGIRVSEEGQEGLNAFLQKRKPAWQ
ncbi:gamma-carboxygeranoyl-CoA hydratase [Pseudomonas daroniae]|uniref:Gamma-carboxygeranoyl-CoA hydratase n=1 Tax=Phytopseudomonas daroniae TaxID=2487519 RepID=A0A4Q9QJP5_9GAMM|nr:MULTISPECIES: gamma-carboxygeranoyl-CoA hydratase [Pseudomonas]TBU75725.1 gamma-carboxygeranoyl-CoA hydratase [Pseudomonas daroniae]TBU80520.1 gamma-carboxygeranoyl-CoA hydratase [Pseudomonas sp. FRB 228]TBU89655.1 gamma-carboxygeranoyl-CoA hydratase [Pseudomonas daroniae]